ncbi:discoidin domain-containing protein [Amorphoplanes digitatis]|uniref:F5/8 type C domain-containing protein n=1 Tax=Actinoplanes digitatis TaxID=1868 RepID=A0A7W7HVZ0_9ACTN|nr:discoidin domain-containing protein [Actinoplanes digitatis]MBB4761745.1 hypothetical protein [Actinoplanes digitatis]GID90856.1 mycodextranase [Actinoplanes digitatis]
MTTSRGAALSTSLALCAAGLFLASPASAAHPPTPVTVAGLPAPATAGRGATVPFTEYEAENAATNGSPVRSDHTYTTIAAEASGRRAVRLAGKHEYVEFTLARPANAVTVRYSVPDSADGRGADSTLGVYSGGRRLASLATTSRYGWYYGSYPFTNVPAQGTPHHYFDEARVRLGRTLPAGSRVRLQVGAADTAAWYVIDLADFETVAPPRPRPAGSLPVTGYGADPTGAADSSDAFDAAIAAASAAGRPVWIPEGTFKVGRHLIVDKVTMTGAGQWYSVLTGDNVGIYGRAPADGGSSDVALSHFAILGEVTERNDNAQVNGIGGALSSSTVSDLWIQHSKVGAWLDGPMRGLTLTRLRILDQTADGVNFHQGVVDSVVENSFVRNTGDDGLAMWSDRDADAGNAFRDNTVISPILANNIAIYGGRDNAVTRNVVADTVTQGGGLHVGNRFNSVPLAGTTTISRNTAIRAGVLDQFWKTGLGALWFWAADSPITGAIAVSDTKLIDSAYEAVQTHGLNITGLSLKNVDIAGAGTFAVQLESPGSATFTGVRAAGLGAGGTYDCGSGFTIAQGPGNVGWQDVSCGFPPPGPLLLDPASVDFGHVTAGTTGEPRIVRIVNPTSRPVTIRSVTVTGDYSRTTNCPARLAPHASCLASVTFGPTRAGSRSGTFTVTGAGSASQQLVALTGDGLSATGDLAEGRPVTVTSIIDGWNPNALTDGNADTFWEAKPGVFPAAATIDLQDTVGVGRAVLQLPDNPAWGARTETIELQGSTDGITFETLLPPTPVLLDAVNAHNTATVTFTPATVRWFRLVITANTGWNAAQLAEVHLHAS